jgi:hypothetical protein
MSALNDLMEKYKHTPIKDIPVLERLIVEPKAVFNQDRKDAAEQLAALQAVADAARELITHEPGLGIHVVSGDYRKVVALAAALDGAK